MASDKKINQFPDLQNKLHAPTKKSLFERQKAEAEAKKRREDAETKAAYDDFVKSFDDDDGDVGSAYGGGRGEEGSRYGRAHFSGPPRRHYGSGPGSQQQLGGRGYGGDRGRGGSGPGSLGPGPGLAMKRTYENYHQPREDRGLLGFGDHDDHASPACALNNEDDVMGNSPEEARAVAKPTLQLSSLPPGTSPAVIKALMPPNLKIDAVRIQATIPSSTSEIKSMGAIVTLAGETAANDIDTAVGGLQNRYLGYGYYLSLHRHLSSAAISGNTARTGLATSASQPFGAKPVALSQAGRGHAPPPHRGGFAPPTSYAPVAQQQQNRSGTLLHVPVKAPQDIKELKLIHKVIESLITHGPEFEALLMSRPNVQREEKWAWIWDPRSTGGVWYRWRLWEVLTGSQSKKGQGKYLPLFEGSSAWKAPEKPLIFEYTTKIDDFVSDSEYVSSDEDGSGDEGAKRGNQAGGPPDPDALADEGKGYLNPLEKAKLTHLLARLPTSTGQLRRGDVARVTAFAISHAGRGADEVVSAIVSNIEKPFTYTSANPDRKKEEDSGDGMAPEDEDSDTSSASLIGIYLISDILSSSSTCGVRHAWRYRQLFEAFLKQRCVFEGLGRMERKMNWGRLRAEKWKRSVGNMLGLWEGWCVFPQESQEYFVTMFNNPPPLAAEEQETKEKESLTLTEKGKSRWKTVEETAKETAKETPEIAEEVDGEAMEEDVDGEPMDDEDVDGAPMDCDDMDAMPMEDNIGGKEMREHMLPPGPPSDIMPAEVPNVEMPVGNVWRGPKAVDMFADSDDED
ncbi:hypothetical protein BJ878DRAFT_523946 [Calycina marina]|uniref:CID domain-containing protein n=1 Tax=Calycina marina TaxID=1763456 RepID=A0A9P7YW53_9HELO|nr:hypothetical protein BJ878DRAFT_523946 [Calycina marina]